MSKPVEELLAVVVALIVLALVGVAFVSFLTYGTQPVTELFIDAGSEGF